MRSTARNFCVLASTASAFALAYAAPASAQSQQADPPAKAATQPAGADDVIVIARKQGERLQDVPVTVTAVTAQTLENFQVHKFEDIASRVPSLTIAVGTSGSGADISLRGVGSSASSAAFDSAVAFDIDGVQISTSRLLQSSFMDVGQIDVLKGPQSLFFGKSATAGVIAVRSADPTKTLEAGGKASYEFEERSWTGQGYISGPLTDTLGFRVAARYLDTSRVTENLAPGVAHRYRGETSTDVRGTLQWDPDSRFSANLKINYNHFHNDGISNFLTVTCGADGKPDPVTFVPGVSIPAGYGCGNAFNGKIFIPDGPPVLTAKPSLPVNGSVPFTNSNIFFGRLKWDVALTERLKFSSVTGYVNLSEQELDNYSYAGVAPPGGFLGVPAGQGFGFGEGIVFNKLRQFTQEFRLASTGGGWLNFMAGAFYENRRIEFTAAQSAVGAPILSILFGLPFPNGADPVTGYTYDYTKSHVTKADAYSLFGSVTMDLTPKLQLSGGGRWTRESKIGTIAVPYDHTFLVEVLGFVPSGFFSGPIHFNDSNFSPEASLRYKLNSDVNVYAAFKTGYKSGGIDTSALPSNALLGFASPNPAVRTATAANLIFKSETSLGGEIGVKAQLADRALTLNGSLFHYVYKNLQVQNFDSVRIAFITTNAGQLTSQGADLDLNWRTPISGLSLAGSVAYTDSKYSSRFVPDAINAPTIDLNGRTAVRAPKLSGNIAPSLEVPFGALKLGINGNARYSSSYFTSDLSWHDYVQKSFWTYDANISIGASNDMWKISLIGVNLSDKIYAISSVGRPYGVDDLAIYTNRGRQIFVEAAFKF